MGCQMTSYCDRCGRRRSLSREGCLWLCNLCLPLFSAREIGDATMSFFVLGLLVGAAITFLVCRFPF